MVVPAPAVVAAAATTSSAASAAWTLTSLVLAVMAPPTSLTLAAWTPALTKASETVRTPPVKLPSAGSRSLGTTEATCAAAA